MKNFLKKKTIIISLLIFSFIAAASVIAILNRNNERQEVVIDLLAATVLRPVTTEEAKHESSGLSSEQKNIVAEDLKVETENIKRIKQVPSCKSDCRFFTYGSNRLVLFSGPRTRDDDIDSRIDANTKALILEQVNQTYKRRKGNGLIKIEFKDDTKDRLLRLANFDDKTKMFFQKFDSSQEPFVIINKNIKSLKSEIYTPDL